MIARLMAAAALTVGLSSGPAILAGQTTSIWTLSELATYRLLVDAYRAGDTVTAVGQVVALGGRQARAAAERLSGRQAVSRVGVGDPDLGEFRAAAMLLIDAAERAWSLGLANDAGLYLELARHWALAASGEPSAEAFLARWSLAAGLLVLDRAGLEPALEFFDRACRDAPASPGLLTAAAWLDEEAALAPVSRRTERRTDGLDLARRNEAFKLQSAVRRLVAALSLAPGSAEPLLRLARVRALQGHDEVARELLTDFLARPAVGPREEYLGRLFLGRIHEREGDTAAAAQLYAQAMSLVPAARSARLGLARVRYEEGRGAEAAELLHPVLTGVHGNAADPWLDYQLGYAMRAATLRDALRAEIRP